MSLFFPFVDGPVLQGYSISMRVSVPILLLCLLAVAGCLGSSGYSRSSMTAEEIANQQREAAAADALDMAMQLYHDGEFLEPKAAFDYLDEAVELDPTLVAARYQRAVLLLEQNRIDEALADVNAIIKVKPDHLKAHYTRGFVRLHLGDNVGAAKDFSMVLDKDNTLADVYAKRGTCYVNLDRPDDALDDFTQALAINPAHLDANYNRGMLYVSLEKYEEAVHDLTQALTLDSQSYDILMARAATNMKLMDYARAVGDFRRAIVLEPRKSVLYALLGEGLAGTGDMKGAIEAVKRALALSRVEGKPKIAAIYQEQLDEYLSQPAPAPAPKAAPKIAPETTPEATK